MTREQVAINICGRGQGTVPKPLLNQHGILSLLEQHAGMEVPKIMKTTTLNALFPRKRLGISWATP